MASSFGMKLLLLTLGLISFVAPAISCSPQFAIVPWGDETTSHPELGKYFFTHDPRYNNPPIKGISDFADASLPLTLDRAIHATKKVKDSGPKLRSDEGKELWSFCVDMFLSCPCAKSTNPTILQPDTPRTTQQAGYSLL